MSNKPTSHYLYTQNLPRQLAPDVLDKLVERLCSGDETVVNDIATSHIRMAIIIARKLTRGRDIDDAVSVGLEGLMEAIYKFPVARTGEPLGIVAYIAKYVRYKILRFRAEDTLIRVPQESQRRLDLKAPSTNTSGDCSKKQYDLVAVNEILKLIATDPLEQIIIKLRRKGYTDQEIADKVDISVSRINAIRNKLEKKFESYE